MPLGVIIYIVIGMIVSLFVCYTVNARGRKQFGNHIYVILGLFWPISVPYIGARILFLRNNRNE